MAAEDGTMQVFKATITAEPSPDEAPEGPDDMWTERLANKWKEIEIHVRRLEQVSGAKYDPDLEVPGVMANLAKIEKKTKDKTKSKWSQFKRHFTDTLTVISKVGGMAAEAASQVFAPAGQCYNAINFVITAWKGYIQAFEVLNEILADCASFLGRLPSYSEGGMDANMAIVTSDALDIFIEVCKKAVKLRTSKGRKFLMFGQIAFLDKGDFTELRGAMDKNTQKEALVGISEGVKYSRRAAEASQATSNYFAESRADQLEREREQRDREALMKVLDFPQTPNSWNSENKEPIETWKTINTGIHNRRVEGTGDWLLHNKPFTAWAKDAKDGKQSLLAFVGGEGAGKSHLISAAISHLRSPNALPVFSKEGKSRRLVAFHYVDNGKPNAQIYSLGKSIIYQFTNDASYKQTVASICRNSDTHIESGDVLEKLLLDIDEQLQKIDAIFFIVIHNLGSPRGNVNDALKKFLKRVLRSNNSAVRVLFSTTEETLKKLKRDGISCPTVQISENNEPDRVKYINHHMDRMRALSKTSDVQVQSVRRNVETVLCQKIKDSYHRLNMELEGIAPLVTEEDILDHLKTAGRTMSEHVQDEIDNLNKVRKPKELAEINEIILWLSYCKRRMTPEFITAVLHVKNGGASLLPIQDQLRDKFRLFEIDDDGFIDFRATDMSDKLTERGNLAQEQENKGEVVTKYEVDIVNHFLANVCPSDLLKKLELNKHFNHKLEARKGEQICKEDKTTGNFLIARACVDALANDDPRLAVLREYAVAHLVNHMFGTNPNFVLPESLAEFGFNLAKLFHDPDTIDNILRVSEWAPRLPPTLLQDEYATEIYRWIKNPIVASKIDAERPRSWWKLEDKDFNSLLEPAIRQMAAQCLLQESSPQYVSRAYMYIRGWCHTRKTCPDAVAEARPPTHEEREKWCQDVLRKETLDTRWHYQMAVIFNNDFLDSKAEDRCRQALKLDPQNWRASILLAKLVESPEEAVGILKGVDKHFQGDQKLQQEQAEAFAEIAFLIGCRYWEHPTLGDATEMYRHSMVRNPSAFEQIFDIITKFDEVRQWEEILDLLDEMSDLDDKLTPFVLAMSKSPRYHSFHTIFLRALLRQEALLQPLLEMIYENAIRTARDQEDYKTSFYLGHFYANALSAISPAPIPKVRQVLEDAIKDLVRTDLDLARSFFLIGYRLGAIYLGEAKQAKTPEAAKRSLAKLVNIVPESIIESQMRLPLSLFAARYYTIQRDKKSAQAEAHNTLKVAMELLSDNDVSNDLFAYRKVLYATIPFRDEKNVNAALAMMKLETNFTMTCSCGCGETWDTPEDMWFCMDCIRVVLKPQCRDRVLDSTKRDPMKPNSVCHESHEHFEIGKWDAAKMAKRPEDHVPYNGKFISMEDWRKNITEQYKLEESIAGKFEAGKKLADKYESGKAKLDKFDPSKKISDKYEAGKSEVRNALRN